MASRSERHIQFFDLVIKAYSRKEEFQNFDGLIPPSALNLFKAIEATHKKGRIIIPIAKGYKSVYFQDIKISKEYATLLINLSDRDAADPAFSDPVAGSRRFARRQKEEGVEGSAHVIIKFHPGRPDTYSLVLESTPGLPSSRIQKFLNLYLRKAKTYFPEKFVCDDPSGTRDKNGAFKKIPINVRILLLGQPSDQLTNDINNGTLSGIEIISPQVSKTNWDERGFVKDKLLTTTLDISELKLHKSIKNWPILKQIFKTAEDKATGVRIKFKTLSGVSRSIVIDPRSSDSVKDDAYIKKEILDNFNHPLESAYDEVHSELATRMYNCVK